MSASLTRAFGFALVISVAALAAAPTYAATSSRGGGSSSSGGSAGGGDRTPDLVSGPQGNCNGAIACVRVPPKPVVRSYSHCSAEVIDRYYDGDRRACRIDLGL